MSNLGTRREYQVRDWFRERDWVAFRAPASLGVADVIALKSRHMPRLVEIKATSRGPWHGFGPKDRADLLFAAEMAGAKALLCWWPKGGKMRFFEASEFPPSNLSR